MTIYPLFFYKPDHPNILVSFTEIWEQQILRKVRPFNKRSNHYTFPKHHNIKKIQWLNHITSQYQGDIKVEPIYQYHSVSMILMFPIFWYLLQKDWDNREIERCQEFDRKLDI
jgi:hypothetical protein